MMQGIVSDLRLAARRLRGYRTGNVVVVLTLGLGIGASTAIFSVVHAVLLRPLPFPGSDRLVRIDEEAATRDRLGLSLPVADLLGRDAPALHALALFEARTAMVIVNSEADRLPGASVSRNFLDVLQVRPALGRPFSPEPQYGSPDEVIISYALWQRLGGRADVVGTSLAIDPGQFTIVGVVPPGFSYPAESQFWTNLPKEMAQLQTVRDVRFLTAVGRLAPGATLDGLRAELAVLSDRHPASDRIGAVVRLAAIGLRESIVGQSRRGISAVAAAAALVLLSACANVAALLLARATVRRRETAVQAALGASSGRLVRQAAFEVLMLAAASGALGLLTAWICRDAIVRLSLDEIPRIAAVAIDAQTLMFAFLITLLAAAVTTMLPAWITSRSSAAEALSGSRGEGHGIRTLVLLRALVVIEVALTVILVVSGTLLGRTVGGLGAVDPGVTSDGVVAMRLNLPLRPRLARDAELAFYGDVLDRARGVAGVQSAALSSRLPLADALASTETHPLDDPTKEARAILHSTGPGYFSTVGAQIVAGNELSSSQARLSAVINEPLARTLFGTSPAVGRTIRLRHMTGPVDAEVVGVSRPVRYNGLAAGHLPEIYLDYRFRPMPQFLFARVSGDPAGVIPALKAAIVDADPTRRVTIDPITTIEREVARRLARPRFFLALMGTFGVVALVLSAAGLYGVLSFSVAQRRHEIGVRLALGASAGDIFRHVVVGGTMLAGLGLLIGVVAAAGSARALRTLLFGIGPWDGLTFAAAVTTIALTSLAACWIPARRAQRTDPLAVLRPN